MAARGNRIGFTGQFDDQVSGKLGKLRDNFDRLGKSKGAMTVLQGVGMGAGISAWGLLADAMSGALNFVKDGIQGAREETASLARLDAALRANVEGWDSNTDAIERTIHARMDLGFSDDALRDSFSRLVAATGSVREAFDIQRTAMDLARFKTIDLDTATQALIKVEAGQYRALKDLGIVLAQGATQTEALAAVQRVAAGQAEEFGESAAGSAAEFEAKLDNLSEKVGAVVIPAIDDLTESAIGLMDALDSESAATATDRLAAFADVATLLMPVTRALTDSVQAVGDAMPTRNIGHMTRAVAEARPPMRALGRATHATAEDLDDLRDAAEDALDELLNAALGPEELRLTLKDQKAELRENQRELRRLTDIKDPTRDQRDDIRDTKLEIIDNRREIARTATRMKDMGLITFDQLTEELRALGIITQNTADKAWSLAAAYSAIGRATGGGGGGGGGDDGPHRARGGPVDPGRSYVVGESGQERLVMFPGGGGYVFPNAGGGGAGGAGGAPVVIQLQMDGREVARVVDRHLYYEAARAPQSAMAG